MFVVGSIPDSGRYPLIASRYQILSELGHGGMGVVYRAYDQQLGEEIALKTLLQERPDRIYRFKMEFRTLAELAHPNLVRLHELTSDRGKMYLSMELVRGVDFLTYVQEAAEGMPSSSRNDANLLVDVAGESSEIPCRPNLQRLNDVLAQLLEGLEALHAASVLHRDLKPSNVLITAAGRVVLLDFGLAIHLGDRPSDPGAGTVAYMSPEQVQHAALGPSSDYYSLGVMLFEALAGRLPFEGTALEIAQAKSESEAPVISSFWPDVPPQWSRLCAGLLIRDPAQRPNCDEIWGLLGRGDERRSKRRRPVAVSPLPRFLVGRQNQLAQLHAAVGKVAAGRSMVVQIQGRLGYGKTALLQQFHSELRHHQDAVLLSGRCYERERIPYEALDSLMDQLARRLSAMAPAQLVSIMPPDISALTQVFPVLARGTVGKRARAAQLRSRPEVVSGYELRRGAISALQALLGKLAAHGPLILSIDDAQWGDADSAALLEELLAGPVPFLLILCFSPEKRQDSPFLSRLLEKKEAASYITCVIEVGSLSRDQSNELAQNLGVQAHSTAQLAALIDEIHRAAGHPYLISELINEWRQADDSGYEGTTTLDGILQRRIEAQSEDERYLLELCSVAGYPLPLAIAGQLMGNSRLYSALAVLRLYHLVASGTTSDTESVEPYHARIGKVVLELTTVERQRTHHQALASAIAATDSPDAQRLVSHYEQLGDGAAVGHWALIAADQAAGTLAFERAVEQYRIALRYAPDLLQTAAVQRKFAEALAEAGASTEAAERYLTAATLHQKSQGAAEEVLLLKTHAAEHYLRSGALDQGSLLLKELLSAVNVFVPDTPTQLMAAYLFQRARLRLRGIDYLLRPGPPTAELLRVKVCQSAALGLSMVDPLAAGLYHTLHARYALELGDETHIALSLMYEAAHLASLGGRNEQARSVELLQDVGRLLATVEVSSEIRARLKFTSGTQAYFSGDYLRALQLYEEADRICHEEHVGSSWQRASLHLFSLWTLSYRGELRIARDRLEVALRQARAQGDIYAQTVLLGVPTLSWLAAGEVERAELEVDRVMTAWTPNKFTYEHSAGMISQVLIDLYLNRAERAYHTMEENWPRIRRAFLLRLGSYRAELLHLRARCTLAYSLHVQGTARAALWRTVDMYAKKLAADSLPMSSARAALLRAARQALQGNRSRAQAELRRAEETFHSLGVTLYTMTARFQLLYLGEPKTGERSRALNEWKALQQIADPARFFAALAPGFTGTGDV